MSAYRREHAGEEAPPTLAERARLRELKRENRELKMENDFLKKAAAYFAPRPSVTDKFEFIDTEYAAYQESDDMHAVDRENVQVDGGIPVRAL